jgi:hypothetical protein
MCDNPVPCQCTLEKRVKTRREHMERSDRLGKLAHSLWKAEAISEEDRDLLYMQAESEWDDAIHIASSDDPLRSLCGLYGRNLMDLPERPDSWAGCWGCLTIADKTATSEPEMATA